MGLVLGKNIRNQETEAFNQTEHYDLYEKCSDEFKKDKKEERDVAIKSFENALEKDNAIQVLNGFFVCKHGQGRQTSFNSSDTKAIYQAAIAKGNVKAMNNLAVLYSLGMAGAEKQKEAVNEFASFKY